MLSSEAEIVDFAQKLLHDGTEIRLVHAQNSLTGNHYSFDQFFDGSQVYLGNLRIHTNHNGEIVLVQNHLEDLSSAIPDENVHSIGENTSLNWIHVNDKWELAEWQSADQILGISNLILNGKVLETKYSKLFNSFPDSTVSAQVFLINPLNSAGRLYGSPYIDSSDLDVPQLNDERKWVTMKAMFVNDTFWLNARRYGFGDVSDPETAPTFSLTNSFSFERSRYQFEDVNAFYHITTYSNHVESLGFSNLLPDSLVIDAHAYNGADLSSFNFEVDPLELEFGEGGVDDAEDGEVVVHEFGHALSYMASPKTVKGWERSAMEEANCDYFSTSYSREFTDFGWREIFNWDGHNPFWNGVKTGVVKTYPDDLTQSTNADRELWSSPLMCIYEKLGRLVTDTLVLEHLFYQTSNSTMPQMALAMLQIDSLLWNKSHYTDIKECFVQFGILKWGTDTGVYEIEDQKIYVVNTLGFAQNNEALSIRCANDEELIARIYSLDGKQIFQTSGKRVIQIESDNYLPGIYVLNIRQKGVNLSLKLIKQ